MSSHYKRVNNGNGTDLFISEEEYLSVGRKGVDVMIRGNGRALAFKDWNSLIEAIDTSKADYQLADTEAVEVCPHCDSENTYPNWSVEKQGYVAKCKQCGKEIMLCDECFHADDNECGKCDWHTEKTEDGKTEGHCFRGITKE